MYAVTVAVSPASKRQRQLVGIVWQRNDLRLPFRFRIDVSCRFGAEAGTGRRGRGSRCRRGGDGNLETVAARLDQSRSQNDMGSASAAITYNFVPQSRLKFKARRDVWGRAVYLQLPRSHCHE